MTFKILKETIKYQSTLMKNKEINGLLTFHGWINLFYRNSVLYDSIANLGIICYLIGVSTAIIESSFSSMNYIMNKYRS